MVGNNDFSSWLFQLCKLHEYPSTAEIQEQISLCPQRPAHKFLSCPQPEVLFTTDDLKKAIWRIVVNSSMFQFCLATISIISNSWKFRLEVEIFDVPWLFVGAALQLPLTFRGLPKCRSSCPAVSILIYSLLFIQKLVIYSSAGILAIWVLCGVSLKGFNFIYRTSFRNDFFFQIKIILKT